jgi:hypothetical protein
MTAIKADGTIDKIAGAQGGKRKLRSNRGWHVLKGESIMPKYCFPRKPKSGTSAAKSGVA